MVSVASLEKIEIIRSQEFMPSKARLKFLKKMIILGPKTAILGPQFCRILVLGSHFWWSGGPHLDPPLLETKFFNATFHTDPAYRSDTYLKVPPYRSQTIYRCAYIEQVLYPEEVAVSHQHNHTIS